MFFNPIPSNGSSVLSVNIKLDPGTLQCGEIQEMNTSFSHDIDDEYEKFIRRMNPPRVVINNETCKNATVIRVDSANKHDILLEVVQIFTDLNLIITKAYISSYVNRFMDDEGILDYIRKFLGSESCLPSSIRSVGLKQLMDHTAIELTRSDRPGLLSEVSVVLRHLKCNVVSGEVWTHNTRIAAMTQVIDEET
ncbi:hypothetical protein V6N11_050353 [Hibiscus sabdariffa]|uniref:ACT domain-containing protein ACR n=1 Tax=Hibiscus sabdariffa TaxID=183260 RepID=A0ABR2TAL0_9ROSI